jgi:hypothetical protein
VVVGQGDAVGPEQGQQLDRSRWGAEEERLARSVPWPSAFGDAALQVQHDQVGLAQRVPDLRGDQGLGRRRGQGPGDPPGPAWVSLASATVTVIAHPKPLPPITIRANERGVASTPVPSHFAQQPRSNSALRSHANHHASALLLCCNALLREVS